MATTTRHHIEMTRLDSSGNQYILYPKNTLDDVYTSSNGVSIKGKVNFYGTCGTAADTVAKTASITGFSLVNQAHVSIVFTNGISVAIATLNINSTGAKPIFFNGAALKANMIRANARVNLVYDGTNYNVISGAANAPYVTNANTTKAYLLGTPTTGSHMPTTAHYDSAVYLDTTAGQLVATNFKGGGANLTSLSASNISSGTLAKERLATSGATAGSYGPSANATASHGGTITIPKVTVDTYGRVTACSNITITLPTDNNTDTKVTNTLANTTKAYVTGTSTATTNTGGQVFDNKVYLGTTNGYLHAVRFCFNDSTSTYIDSANYTGKAATVGSLSGLLQDNVTGNGVTTKALTANQGYVLQNQITTLNSNVDNMKIYVGNDGKLHFVDSVGADTVLNFSSGNTYTKIQSVTKTANTNSQTINIEYIASANENLLFIENASYAYGFVSSPQKTPKLAGIALSALFSNNYLKIYKFSAASGEKFKYSNTFTASDNSAGQRQAITAVLFSIT